MAKYVLNTKSGFLHNEDHDVNTDNSETFSRIDAADLFSHRELRTKMQFCQQCFSGQPRLAFEEPEVVIEKTAPEDMPTYAEMLDNSEEDD